MRIVCPSCSAAYDVPDSLLTDGRIVRCARCGSEWAPVTHAPVEPAEPAAELAMPPLPTLTADASARSAVRETAADRRQSAMDWLAAHPVALRSRLPLRIAWAASFVIIASAVWGAYAWRSQIMEAWPPSTRAYSAFGLRPS